MSKDEIPRAFAEGPGGQTSAILPPAGLARLIGITVKTVYQWIGQGRLDGAFRKRGKHVFIWRDRALDILFNGKEWT